MSTSIPASQERAPKVHVDISPPVERSVTLAMTETQARLLATLLHRFESGLTGGVQAHLPEHLRRGPGIHYGHHLNAIYDALTGKGVTPYVETFDANGDYIK